MKAKTLLKGDLQIILVKDDKVIKIFDRGISPWIEMVDMAWNLSGFSVAVTHLSSAAAYMCQLLKVREVYAAKMSSSAATVLKKYDIAIDAATHIEEGPDSDFIGDGLDPKDVYSRLKEEGF